MKQKLYIDLYVHFFSRAVSKGRSNFSSQYRVRAFVCMFGCGQLPKSDIFSEFQIFQNQNVFQDILSNSEFWSHTPYH